MPRHKKTVDDFMAIPDEGYGLELIRGEFAVSPSPGGRHQRLLWKLASAFDHYLERTKAGAGLFGPMDVILDEETIVQPDLLFVRSDRRNIIMDRVRGAPDLVVEILSPTSFDRDRFVKRDLYERHGVAEYWIVDPEARTIEILSLRDGAYGLATVYEADATIEGTAVLPGLGLSLTGLWD